VATPEALGLRKEEGTLVQLLFFAFFADSVQRVFCVLRSQVAIADRVIQVTMWTMPVIDNRS
jgi:hypothetical protein